MYDIKWLLNMFLIGVRILLACFLLALAILSWLDLYRWITLMILGVGCGSFDAWRVFASLSGWSCKMPCQLMTSNVAGVLVQWMFATNVMPMLSIFSTVWEITQIPKRSSTTSILVELFEFWHYWASFLDHNKVTCMDRSHSGFNSCP